MIFAKKMKKIKLSIDYPKEWVIRQTPNNDGIWGDYKFYINDDIDECDYWVVYGKGINKKESCIVPNNHTILMIGEPTSVYRYNKIYMNKFGVVVSCDEKTDAVNNVMFNQPSIPWWISIENANVKRVTDKNRIKIDNASGEDILVVNKKYSDFVKQNEVEKNRLISVMVSNKTITKGHRDRLEFVDTLKQYFGDVVDVFGRGYNEVRDKDDAIRDYKYHVVLENYSTRYYWTEKLADSLLGNSYPIYYGCTNINEYFPKEALSIINIYDVEKSICQIKKIIEQDIYSKRINELFLSKQLVLEKYNLFPQIIKYCELIGCSNEKKKVELGSDKAYMDFNKAFLFASRLYNVACSKVFAISGYDNKD